MVILDPETKGKGVGHLAKESYEELKVRTSKRVVYVEGITFERIWGEHLNQAEERGQHDECAACSTTFQTSEDDQALTNNMWLDL